MVSLWQFALDCWQPDFEKHCLSMQDTYQVPVSVLLAGLWLAANNKQPDVATARRLAACAEQFEHDYLRPLRAVRRRAGEPPLADFKQRLLQAELAGEQQLLTDLSDLSAGLVTADKDVDPLAWLLLLIPEAGQCEGLQRGLEALV